MGDMRGYMVEMVNDEIAEGRCRLQGVEAADTERDRVDGSQAFSQPTEAWLQAVNESLFHSAAMRTSCVDRLVADSILQTQHNPHVHGYGATLVHHFVAQSLWRTVP
jgi:hypothetical protein